mgnify:CR=1 FL=1
MPSAAQSPMSEAAFWFTHLSPEQQSFCVLNLNGWKTENELAEMAYKFKDQLRVHPKWPETKMREV